MKIKIIPKITVILGVVLLIAALIIPYDVLESIIGNEPNPVGIIIAFIIPFLGFMGSIVSLYKKQWLFLSLNIVLIITFYKILLDFI